MEIYMLIWNIKSRGEGALLETTNEVCALRKNIIDHVPSTKVQTLDFPTRPLALTDPYSLGVGEGVSGKQ